ncbi:MAG: hypothetical protein IKU73_02020 [Clostridia bacterium]|nr:hypothetical protein [Clostridia bacterium]
MILASFDAERSREAAISGAYQYDTGQRIRMYGLPAPDELSQMDDFLSGDAAAVEAHFSFEDDASSEPRPAQYDEENGCWVAEIPDAYLTRAETVRMHVYVMYGENDVHSRSKTMYTGSFTPIARPAPNAAVTPDQKSAWDLLVAEVNLTLADMNASISQANAAAVGARTSAEAAVSAAERADSAGNAWGAATTSAATLEPGQAATVSATTNADGTKHLSFGIPRGEKGDAGPQGPKGDTGTAGVTFRLDGGVLYIDTV